MSAGVWKYILIALAILYFLLPWDFLPDLLGIFGRFDDLLVALYLFYRYGKILKREEERIAQQARAEAESRHSERTEARGGGKPEVGDPYAVLGVSSDATDGELQDAYRKRAAEYHPDKVNHLGPDLKELAHNKMIAIQQAFEELKRRRGM